MKTSHALAIAASLLVTASVHAATINTGTITTDTDIVNTGGSLIAAQNFGGTSGASADVNGISHTTSDSAYSPVSFSGNFANPSGFVGELFDLLDGIAGTVNASEPGTITVGGLTINSVYLFQAYWIVNNGEGRTLDVTIEGDSLNGIAQGTQAAPILISYQFTAGDNTLNAGFVGNGSDGNVFISGFSLQEVPSVIPTPAALPAGLALLGLAAMRRRKF